MFRDYVHNGQAHGEVGRMLEGVHFDTGFMRPYLDKRDNVCVTINTGEYNVDDNTGDLIPKKVKARVAQLVSSNMMNPLLNATSMRREDWIRIDRVLLSAARPRLKAWNDARAASTLNIPGMSSSILEHERITDVGNAKVDMYDLTSSDVDSPHFQPETLPLPITHAGFHFSEREIAISRAKGTAISMTTGEMAARRVADTIEKTIIGVTTGLTYGPTPSGGNASTVYGYTNHPDRITKTDLTSNTTADPDDTLAEVLAMLDLAKAQNFFGPFMLYTTNDWDQYMDNDYVTGTAAQGLTTVNATLRDRLRRIDDIRDVRRLDFWTDTSALLLVQMSGETIRAVNGMEITTVRWETVGKMMKNFKVMAIQVPNIRAQFIGTSQTSSKTGIVHATTA